MDKFTHSNKTYNESFANSYDIITGHKEYVEEVKQLDQILNANGIEEIITGLIIASQNQ